jgi:hypothetical protein
MPDLDKIKQGEQGRGTGADPQGRRACLVSDPTAVRLCLERILPPCGERTVKFPLPPIQSAPTGQSAWAEGGRHRRRDEGGHLGAGRRCDHAGRRGHDSGVGRHLCPDDDTSDFERRLKEARTACPGMRARRPGGLASVRVEFSTDRRDFAADSLQMQQTVSPGKIDG